MTLEQQLRKRGADSAANCASVVFDGEDVTIKFSPRGKHDRIVLHVKGNTIKTDTPKTSEK